MKRLAVVLCFSMAGAGLAHQGVKNPAVMARMHNMMQISDAMKELGAMAKGQAPFDAAKANAALGVVGERAGETKALFEAQEDDPKSEAKAEIWTEFSDFAAKADALEAVAGSIEPFASLDDVKAALPKLGEICSACHKAYRK